MKRNNDRRLADLKVLLVEDVPDNQILIERFLCAAGAKVEIANNGKEGIEMALSGKYDIVLMDIQMPVLDGYEATRQLRSRGYNSPIVAFTAHALHEEPEKVSEVGFDAHFSKPVEFAVLIDRVLDVILLQKCNTLA
jgi:CheY-like chemotaxis protein